MALWILPKRGLLCVGAKANVPLCGGKKLNKKMCGGEKKKHRGFGKLCRISSCPFVIWSVCLCLSVKMVYASLVCLSVTVRVVRSFTLVANQFICATFLNIIAHISALYVPFLGTVNSSNSLCKSIFIQLHWQIYGAFLNMQIFYNIDSSNQPLENSITKHPS